MEKQLLQMVRFSLEIARSFPLAGKDKIKLYGQWIVDIELMSDFIISDRVTFKPESKLMVFCV